MLKRRRIAYINTAHLRHKSHYTQVNLYNEKLVSFTDTAYHKQLKPHLIRVGLKYFSFDKE